MIYNGLGNLGGGLQEQRGWLNRTGWWKKMERPHRRRLEGTGVAWAYADGGGKTHVWFSTLLLFLGWVKKIIV